MGVLKALQYIMLIESFYTIYLKLQIDIVLIVKDQGLWYNSNMITGIESRIINISAKMSIVFSSKTTTSGFKGRKMLANMYIWISPNENSQNVN